LESADAFLTLALQWLIKSETAGVCHMSSYVRRSSDLDQGFSRREDLEEVDHARTRRLVAKLFHVVRPTLAAQPSRRENVYIALDAVAWAAAMILAGTEDRDALDFFTLALTQTLARLEVRNGDDPPPVWCSEVGQKTHASLPLRQHAPLRRRDNAP